MKASHCSVAAMPSFLIKPTNQEVGRGRTATLQCVVTGNPPPTVFWSKGKEQVGTVDAEIKTPCTSRSMVGAQGF